MTMHEGIQEAVKNGVRNITVKLLRRANGYAEYGINVGDKDDTDVLKLTNADTGKVTLLQVATDGTLKKMKNAR